jgi:Tfp pilus assembly protein PilO
MPDLAGSRRSMKIALGAMLAVDVLAVAVLFSPLVGSAESRRQQLNQMRAELTKKNQQVAPLRNIPDKIVLAKAQISDFYKGRFAEKDSDLIGELGKVATANGVRMQTARYKEEEPEISGIVPIEIEGSFAGDYLQLVRFINALERSKMFFAVDGIELAGESTGAVKLGITMHSYLRSGV